MSAHQHWRRRPSAWITISSNLANVETTSTPEGGPYKKKSVYFQSKPLSFQEQLDNNLKGTIQGVEVTKILEDQDPPNKIFNPTHPDADKDGYVAMPNISVLKEMVEYDVRNQILRGKYHGHQIWKENDPESPWNWEVIVNEHDIKYLPVSRPWPCQSPN